jgi:hypothetical protein
MTFARSMKLMGWGAVAAASALAADSPQSFAAPPKVYEFVAVTEKNDLIHFRSDAPSTITHRVHITGTFEWTIAKRDIRALAARPATGQLYAMDNGHLYVIDPWTGVATWSSGWLAGGPNQIDTTEYYSRPSMDFEPDTGWLRVVAERGLTFRIDADAGTVIDADASKPGVQPDRDRLYFVDGDPQIRDISPSLMGFAFDPTNPGKSYSTHNWTGLYGSPSLVRIDGFGPLRSSTKTVSTVGPQYIAGGGVGDCTGLLEIAPDGAAWRISQRVNAKGAFLSRVDLTSGAVNPAPGPYYPWDTGTEILFDENVVAFCVAPVSPAQSEPPPPPVVREPPVVVPPPPPPPPPPAIPVNLDTISVDVDLTKPAHDDVALGGSLPFNGGDLAGQPVDVTVGDASVALELGRNRTARDAKASIRVSRVHKGRVRFRIRLASADLADEVASAAADGGAPLPVVVTLAGTRYAADVPLSIRRHGTQRIRAVRARE